MINLEKNNEKLQHNIQVAREHKIVLPTFAQMKNPDLVPEKIKEGLKKVGLWDVDPLNLFRITWHNEPTMQGGTYGGVNFLEIPSSLSGVKAKIIIMIGKWFPTGCHKVGASYGCLVPRLVTGQFDATYNKAVWPSTGNYCRGGAFNSKLLSCDSIAILPAEMSKERFDWLSKIAGEVIVNKILKPEQTTTVLLETMAGKGSEVGSTFEELRAIIDRVQLKEKIGVCLDTCHVHDAGYDIVNDLDGVLGEFDRIIGLEYLKAIHVNDSKNPCEAHKDRHACIGEGYIGKEAMARILSHPKLAGLPCVLETPQESLAGYGEEIKMIREMI